MAPSASRTKLVESMPAKSWSVWWESELPIAATMNWMWLKRTAMLINTPAMFYSSEPSSLGSQTLLEPYPICATEKPISPHWQQMRDEESQSHILWHVALRHCVTFFVASRITVLYLQFMVLRFWACPKLGIPPIHSCVWLWRSQGPKKCWSKQTADLS